jgi:hypothetical protein
MTALGLYNGKALLRCNTAGAPHVATKQLEMYFATKQLEMYFATKQLEMYFATKQLEMCFPSHAPLARGKKWHSPKTCTCITSCKTLEDDSLKLYIEAGAGRHWLPVSARRRVRVQDVQRGSMYIQYVLSSNMRLLNRVSFCDGSCGERYHPRYSFIDAKQMGRLPVLARALLTTTQQRR